MWNLFDDLWRHISRCSTIIWDYIWERANFQTEAKINDLHITFIVKQYVLHLDISMSNILWVTVVNSFQDFPEHNSRLRLFHRNNSFLFRSFWIRLINFIMQTLSLEIFSNDIIPICVLNKIFKPDNAWVKQSLKNFHFLSDTLSPLEIWDSGFLVDFDCYFFTCWFVSCLSHTSISTSPNYFPNSVMINRWWCKNWTFTIWDRLWSEIGPFRTLDILNALFVELDL